MVKRNEQDQIVCLKSSGSGHYSRATRSTDPDGSYACMQPESARSGGASVLSSADAELLNQPPITLIAEPVCGVDDLKTPIFHACDVQFRSRFALCAASARPFIEASRAQEARRIDSKMVDRAISALRAQPRLCLSLPLCAPSLQVDARWAWPIEQLESLPEVASRLIFSIIETAQFAVEGARDWGLQIRRLGCRIAITGFGPRYGENVHRAFTSPDLIVIDNSWLVPDRPPGRRHAAMFRLAQDFAPQVIACGVDAPSDLLHARQAGARWVQGAICGEKWSVS